MRNVEARAKTIRSFHRSGFSMAMTLIFAVILLLIGIVITGLTTMQSRYSYERNNDIITRQAAVAGVNVVQKALTDLTDWSTAKSAVHKKEGCLADTGAWYYIECITPPDPNDEDQTIEIISHGCFKAKNGDLSAPEARINDKKIRMVFGMKNPMMAISATGTNRPIRFSDIGSYDLPDELDGLVNRVNTLHSDSKYFSDHDYYNVLIDNTDVHGEIGTALLKDPIQFPKNTPVLIASVRMLDMQSATMNNQTVKVMYPTNQQGLELSTKIIANGLDPAQSIKRKPVPEMGEQDSPEQDPRLPDSPGDLILDSAGSPPLTSGNISKCNYVNIGLYGNVVLGLRNGINEVDNFIAVGDGENQPRIKPSHGTEDVMVIIVKKKLELINVRMNAPKKEDPDPRTQPGNIVFHMKESYTDTDGFTTKHTTACITDSQCNFTISGKADVFVNSSLIQGSLTGNTVTVTGTSNAPDSCKVEFRPPKSKSQKALILKSWEEL